MKVRISNIQRFCLHDGPGIRTTIFLKGCSLKCPWCCNPENISYENIDYVDNGENKVFGYDITLEDLEKEIMKDYDYYENDGGITLSGGEALLQIEKLEPLLKSLYKKNIDICLETSLSVSSKLVDIALKYINTFYIDIKILDKNMAKEILNMDVENYLNNLEKVLNSKKNVVLRFPINEEYTLKKENINKICKFIENHPNIKIEIFKTHNLGESKYNLLKLNYKRFVEVDDKKVEEVFQKFTKCGAIVDIIKI